MQWLNIGIFQAIGHAGVYYGFKLGHTIPWVDGFPFNVVRAPTPAAALCALYEPGGVWHPLPTAGALWLVFSQMVLHA